MAARKNASNDTNITFKVGDTNYRILVGQGRDFLSAKGKEGGWSIMDDASTAAVAAILSSTARRLVPTE